MQGHHLNPLGYPRYGASNTNTEEEPGNPHGGEHLKELLVGQMLWLDTTQLLWLAGVSAVLLALATRPGAARAASRWHTAWVLWVTPSAWLCRRCLTFRRAP